MKFGNCIGLFKNEFIFILNIAYEVVVFEINLIELGFFFFRV